jgi:hypothetical protein
VTPHPDAGHAKLQDSVGFLNSLLKTALLPSPEILLEPVMQVSLLAQSRRGGEGEHMEDGSMFIEKTLTTYGFISGLYFLHDL